MSKFNKNNRFHMERLEDRQMMAGDVTAFLNNGTLFIQEAVGSFGGEQNIEIIQVAPNKVQLMGATSPGNPSGTKINGSLSAPVIEITPGAKIDVQLGAGNDSVRVFGKAGQTFLSPITINTSNSLDPAIDNDFVQILNMKSGRNLDITTGAGADVVQVNNVQATGLVIRAGTNTPGLADADQVSVVNATLFGSLHVMTGEGSDAVTVKSLNIPTGSGGRHLTIETGAGADTIKVGSNLLGTPNPDLTPVGVAGVVHIIAGKDAQADADVVQMQDVFADLFMTVELGGGDDRLDLFRSTAGESISLAGQKGNDTMNVIEVQATDGFFANLGEGNDVLSITYAKAQRMTLDGGAGTNDRLSLSQMPNIPSQTRSGWEFINGIPVLQKKGISSAVNVAMQPQFEMR